MSQIIKLVVVKLIGKKWPGITVIWVVLALKSYKVYTSKKIQITLLRDNVCFSVRVQLGQRVVLLMRCWRRKDPYLCNVHVCSTCKIECFRHTCVHMCTGSIIYIYLVNERWCRKGAGQRWAQRWVNNSIMSEEVWTKRGVRVGVLNKQTTATK